MPPRPRTVRRPRRFAAVPVLVLATVLCISAWARDHTAAVSPPITLAADQARAVGFLLDVRPKAPAPLFLFTDPNNDPDDLSVLVLAAGLAEEGFIDTSFGHPRGEVATDGVALLESELTRVADGFALLLVNAGMADVATLLRNAPELVKRKTAKVVIMGGVEPTVDERGFVDADRRAYNNTIRQPSADYVYARVQEFGIPLVVVAKEAAYAAAVPRGFYEGMAATGHPIGVYLREATDFPTNTRLAPTGSNSTREPLSLGAA